MTGRATEAQCQDAIVSAAKLAGWRVHAERTAQTGRGWRTAIQGHAGWPDLVLVRPPKLLVVELKRHPNKVQRNQGEWVEALRLCGVDVRIVWVPEEMAAFIDELTQRPVTS